MPKPILFIDFDGTLCHDKFWRSLDSGLQAKIQARLFVSGNGIVTDWMIGKYSSEEINTILADELGVEYDVLWPAFVRDCKTMFIEGGALRKIGELRDRYTTVLMTDNMDSFDRFTIPALKLDTYFDRIVNSFSQRILKDEDNGKSFRNIIAESTVPISEHILMDNSKTTCDISQRIGGKFYLVTQDKPVLYWLDQI